MFVRVTGALLFGLLLGASQARADGAFPDEFAVFVPATRPHEIDLMTNFGPLISVDDGATFRWICEQAITNDPLGNAPVWRYQRGGDNTIYGLYSDQVAHSADNGCTWSSTALPGDGFDLFADPTVAGRLFAIWEPPGQSQGTVLVSTDQGSTFDAPLLASTSGTLFGVESAASNPDTIYVTGYHSGLGADPAGPYISRTDDNGAHFTSFPHAEVGTIYSAFIAAVDPTDPRSVYLRVRYSGPDFLYETHDGGETWTKSLETRGTMSAFVRSSDGAIYVATREQALFVRAPGASTFQMLPAPRLRCLGERNGVLYGCGDNTLDGFALGKSSDGGKTWTPVLQFNLIADLVNCPGVRQTCAAAWLALKDRFQIVAKDAGPGVTTETPPCGCSGADVVAWPFLLIVWRARRRPRATSAPCG
jgi:photosystem II stability/assembly factor-like uncharacterized protein